VRKSVHHQRYLTAILAELGCKAALFPGRRAGSVYFGGGTPSLWRPDCVAAALAAVLRAFPPPDGVLPEVTLECDPADTPEETLIALRAAGVNRLSIGAQTFSDRHLQVLGRRHASDQIPALVQAARRAGFDNLSLDLMIGLIGQRRRELDQDLCRMLALLPEHVSLYQLTVEPRTPLAAWVRRGKTAAPDPDAQAAAYERVRTALALGGYLQYEISNFARAVPSGSDAARFHSRHNSLYWTGGEYLGLGVGAHSFRRSTSETGAQAEESPRPLGERFANRRGLDPYLSLFAPAPLAAPSPTFVLGEGGSGLALYERLLPDALSREAVWLGLRRLEGFSCERFAAEYGIDPRQKYAEAIAAMTKRGYLEVVADKLRLTASGVLFADEVGASFL